MITFCHTYGRCEYVVHMEQLSDNGQFRLSQMDCCLSPVVADSCIMMELWTYRSYWDWPRVCALLSYTLVCIDYLSLSSVSVMFFTYHTELLPAHITIWLWNVNHDSKCVMLSFSLFPVFLMQSFSVFQLSSNILFILLFSSLLECVRPLHGILQTVHTFSSMLCCSLGCSTNFLTMMRSTMGVDMLCFLNILLRATKSPHAQDIALHFFSSFLCSSVVVFIYFKTLENTQARLQHLVEDF